MQNLFEDLTPTSNLAGMQHKLYSRFTIQTKYTHISRKSSDLYIYLASIILQPPHLVGSGRISESHDRRYLSGHIIRRCMKFVGPLSIRVYVSFFSHSTGHRTIYDYFFSFWLDAR